MRKLFYIPIIHTPEDLGSHLEEAEKEYVARYGLLKWRGHLEAIKGFWKELTRTLLFLPVDYTAVRLYQDSLPVCGKELEIVKELAHNGNRNYLLLLELAIKGATVMGTEDPGLLMEERERLNRRGIAAPGGFYDELIERRDEYIAHRIASTLRDGEIGLLFIGALHRVAERLPQDIQVHKSLTDLKEKA